MRKENLTPDDAVRKETPAAKPNSFEARLDAFMLRHPRLSIDEATDALIASKPSQDALRSLRHMERTFGLSRPGDAKWPEIDRAAFRTKVAEWRAKKAMHQIPIDEEFKALIPPMRPEELAKLEESIQREGCRDPLVVWKGSGLLLDGHNRYEICRRLEQPYAITELALDSREAATAWILENQLSRRNLTDAAFAYFLGKTYEARKADHGGDRRSKEASRSNGYTLKRTREALAEEKKVSPQTVANAAAFARSVDTLANGAPEVRCQLLSEESELSRKDVNAMAALPAEQRQEAAEAIAKGKARARPPANPLFSSQSDKWNTPKEILDLVVRMLGTIDLDPCSNAAGELANVPAKRHYCLADDGLAHKWTGKIFMNPPYGKDKAKLISPWTAKFADSYAAGEMTEGIALLPARTDTDWFQPLGATTMPMCFIDGRLNFSGYDTGAPFPSVLVYAGSRLARFAKVFGACGFIRVRYQGE